jgi:ribosomal protein S18 acetylase RimI-like enzyme
LIDLRRICARDLDPVLEEEVAAWKEELSWDFEASAGLVRRFVDLHALTGGALVAAGKVIGYAYYVLEESKALVGGLYVRRQARSPALDRRLLDLVLREAMVNPTVRRIESQLMMAPLVPDHMLPFSQFVAIYERNFMRLRLLGVKLDPKPVRRPVRLEKWSDAHQEAAARLIAKAYEGHIDSRINDQYCSVAGARRLLSNIVQFPGCGTFFRPASYLAFEEPAGRLCGMSLASLVAQDSGHITQICVSPAGLHRTGIGRELMRQSLKALLEFGCQDATLAVTAANRDAMALYEHLGFSVARRFSAYVWEGF